MDNTPRSWHGKYYANPLTSLACLRPNFSHWRTKPEPSWLWCWKIFLKIKNPWSSAPAFNLTSILISWMPPSGFDFGISLLRPTINVAVGCAYFALSFDSPFCVRYCNLEYGSFDFSDKISVTTWFSASPCLRYPLLLNAPRGGGGKPHGVIAEVEELIYKLQELRQTKEE